MSGWLIEGNTVIDAQMGIMVGGGRDTIVKGNNFINCDKGLHIDNRGMGGEKPDCLGPDMAGLKAAMGGNSANFRAEFSIQKPGEMCNLSMLWLESSAVFARTAPAWAKYGLSDAMSPAGNASICSPVNASAVDNCFKGNVANWEVWCGEPGCMNDPKWLSESSGNTNGTCGQ